MERESSNRTSQASISAALAAANAALRDGVSRVRFPGEDGGCSLGEMAQRDLDAALQLLADRAQYITGSTGAAIALRRNGGNDMQCRASTGSNAPELGALLSTEFGLSGESVRTRRILRCDDAELDARVNQDVCREMGIASVVVMPVVHDDEVLGVFELFSGKAKAFGERDLTALQRLSEMVETAVTLARTAEGIPVPMETAHASVLPPHEEDILEMQDLAPGGNEIAIDTPSAVKEPEATGVSAAVEAPQRGADVQVVATPGLAKAVRVGETPGAIQAQAEANLALPPPEPQPEMGLAVSGPPRFPATSLPSASLVPEKKPLFWSAALNVRDEGPRGAQVDQSHVPPAFRNLSKCEACGFPVSAGRALCVECEEKKWRGQLKIARAVTIAASGAAAAAAPAPDTQALKAAKPPATTPFPAATPVAPTRDGSFASKTVEAQELAPVESIPAPMPTAAKRVRETEQLPIPTLVLTAGLEPSQSWLARNKYIVGALMAVLGTIIGILVLR